MRAKPMALIVIAAVCGLVASIGISQVMDAKSANVVTEVPMEKIYVALNDINLATKLDEKHVRLESWPKDRVPQGAITKLEDLKDKYPAIRFLKDEPILAAKLNDRLGGVSGTIPDGYRVIPVKVSAENGYGLITPGDTVDVLVTLRRSADIPVTGTKTVLTNIRVFAVGVETERNVDKDGKAVSAQTISLLVTPKQAQKVMIAAELGKIQLSLRGANSKDEKAEDDDASMGGLFGDEPAASKPLVAPVAKTSPGQTPAEFNAMMQKWQESNKPTALRVETLEPAPSHSWVMEVHSPEGVRYLKWENPQDAPVEVAANSVSTKSLATQRVTTDTRALIGTKLDIAGKTLHNTDFDWQKYRGKPTMVVFWASWCPSCKGELPLIKKLQDAYNDRGLSVVTVNFDKETIFAGRCLVENQVNWETLFGAGSEQLAEKVAVNNIPTILLFDPDGRLNAIGNHVVELLPTISLMMGSPPPGVDMRSFISVPANTSTEEATPPATTVPPAKEPSSDTATDSTKTTSSRNVPEATMPPATPPPAEKETKKPNPSE